MKIVITIHHFPPNYNAGAEIYAYRLAKWLLHQGHQVHVVSVESVSHVSSQELTVVEEPYEGIPVSRLYFNYDDVKDPFRASYQNCTIGKWFAEFLEREKPELVHVNSCYLLSAETIFAAKQEQLPVIVTLHDFWFVCPRIILLRTNGDLCEVPEDPVECVWCLAGERRRFRIPDVITGGVLGSVAHQVLHSDVVSGALGFYPDAHEIAFRREYLIGALQQANLILTPSEFLRDVYISQGISPEKIQYSRQGLDTSIWATPQPVERNSGDGLRIVYIGQLAKHKGVHLLVEAFTQLDLSEQKAHLKIYGGLNTFPKYVAKLKQMANGNPAIEFAGRFDNPLVSQILAEADVVVVPSIWYENSPMAIMEPLTAGVPVVTANLGAMPEMVKHDVNGLLFEGRNAADLSVQLQRLLDEPDLLAHLSANAKPVRMLDEEMQHILSVYDKVISE
ncbi:MAG: glycosyltransferase family 4 protein [Anaerolineales bacterium]|nr:glycosyltransferase family 4 protein [Anaerolineales bacterium]